MKKHVTILIGIIILCLLASVLTFTYLQVKKPVITEHEININVGDTYHLNLSDIFLKADCKWNSSDNEIASVDGKGTIIGQKEGSALITCSVNQKHKTYKFLFNVKVLS